ncbi:NADH dehydrogenase subunit N [Flavimobilis soli]|uniref:NADH-quinone oxidoreductase subunit N n=1 Tax=Flavimobilis soli TaxID=442709 RepID=A0A2A9EBN9_9MICO|nr:NADH-quinone oxidoreductase subunit NuoN [Flavimobilis soli]PFG36477.1 NADH dehydrogenase subunit N [Flavimobilis soli]
MSPVFVEPTVDWFLLAPYILVLGGGVLGVLLEALLPARVRRPVQLTLSLVVLLAAAVMMGAQWSRLSAEEPVLLVLGGSVVLTYFSLILQVIVLVVAALALLVVADRTPGGGAFAPTAAAVPGSDYEELARRKGLEQTEVYPLFLFAVGGMMVLPAAGDLITMFIGLEVLSLPLYVLVGMARHRRLLSQEASLKYFLLGSFASAIFLMGAALVYGWSGKLRLTDILGAGLTTMQDSLSGTTGDADLTSLLVVGVLMMLVGALFKVGAAPFHQWTPDVYQGAPTPITGFMAACTKVAAFGVALRVAYWTIPLMLPEPQDALLVGLWTVAILTMLVGSVVAVVQHDVKRVLAYSSIAHAGFVLVAVGSVQALDPMAELDMAPLPAVLFYLFAYGLATVGAFAVVHLVRETAPASGAGEGVVVLGEATHLSQWTGLGKRSPWLAGSFLLFLLSFAGIPLTAGFIGKFSAFSVAVDAGLWWLALIGVLCSAIAVFFYVRIIVLMFFVDPAPVETTELVVEGAAAAEPVAADAGEGREAGVGLQLATAPVRTSGGVTVLKGSLGSRVSIALCAIATVVLGVFPGPVLDLVAEAAKFIP